MTTKEKLTEAVEHDCWEGRCASKYSSVWELHAERAELARVALDAIERGKNVRLVGNGDRVGGDRSGDVDLRHIVGRSMSRQKMLEAYHSLCAELRKIQQCEFDPERGDLAQVVVVSADIAKVQIERAEKADRLVGDYMARLQLCEKARDALAAALIRIATSFFDSDDEYGQAIRSWAIDALDDNVPGWRSR